MMFATGYNASNKLKSTSDAFRGNWSARAGTVAAGDTSTPLEHFCSALTIRERFTDTDPTNAWTSARHVDHP